MGQGELHISPVEMAAAPYRYDLLTWEVSHLPDKWLFKLWSLLPWNSRSRQERLEDLREFFQIGQEVSALERELADLRGSSSPEGNNPDSSVKTSPGVEAKALAKRLDALGEKRSSMKPGVEETLESEVSAVLAQEGVSSRIGLIFPPVDVALSSPPRVLVVSPRARIHRTETVLLKPNMKVDDIEVLEKKIFDEQDLVALVENIGGVATYPTIVRGDSSLRHAAITTAHEWLHTYWFFRPLGWNFWDSPEMTTLNETAATLASRELGNRVYEAITGGKAEEHAPSDAIAGGEELAPEESEGEGEGGFDFDREMRNTRLRVDELLAEGKVADAEAYMEDRRRRFVDNGFYIRKLNQAYFAFHGTYATSPASVSPIGDEVERLQSMTDSVGKFIRTMSGFGSYQEFRDYLARLSDSVPIEPQSEQAPQTPSPTSGGVGGSPPPPILALFNSSAFTAPWGASRQAQWREG